MLTEFKFRNNAYLILIFICISACSSDPKTRFTKLSPTHTGIDFKNQNTETENGNILVYEYFYNGGGVALGDINNDGLVDVYFSSNSGPNKLYLNKGDFHFEDVTVSSGVGCEKGWKTGVCMVDMNADGWLDIYVSRSALADSSLRKNILLINNKNLTFTDQAETYGLADDSYSTQASFFDYDHDGDLDALLLNHSLLRISNSFDIAVKNTTKRFPRVGNKLLRNDNGKLIDVSDSLGIFGPASNYGLGISLSDINNDGWVDVYTGSDYTWPDKLLLNEQGEFFTDATDSMLSHISKFTMGTDIADFNGDGQMDIFTADMLPEDNKRQKLLLGTDRYNAFNEMVKSGLHYQYMRNMLQLNSGLGYFSEIGQLAGVSNTDWSWASLFADFDNDGVQDLFVSNGFKRDLTNSDFAKYHAFEKIEEAHRQGKNISYLALIDKFRENKIHNYIFKGKDNLTFEDEVEVWGLQEPNLTNGVAYGDLDNDGDLDLVMNNLNDVAGVYRNNSEADKTNHYLKVQLRGNDKNTEAIGSKVTVYAGAKQFTRELFPVRGFQSSVDPALHFGLGQLEHIDSLVVRWPDGKQQRMMNVSVDQKLEIKALDQTSHPVPVKSQSYFTQLDDAIIFTHHENEFVDFDIQSLLPRKYSTMGPALTKGDINNDGLIDLFVGGAKSQAAAILIQNKEGKFNTIDQPDLAADKNSEDTDAVFFDADQDGDLDLYVVSGGYEFEKNDKLLQDRLYKNDGHAKFTKTKSLPIMLVSGSCVRPADIDQDGDLDLFVGGRLIPGRYPEIAESYILVNDGKGFFSIHETELKNVGMVTDAVWVDLNGDKRDDLIVVGEWMGIEVFINDKGKLVKRTSQFIKENTQGWWNCIVKNDFDGDGDQDFIVGNVGLNNQLKASQQHPVTLVYGDFDDNGSIDPILTHYIMGKSYPYPSRDELTEQIPGFKKRFRDYTSYSDATLDNILSENERQKAKMLVAVQMQSCYLRNDGDHLAVIPLPVQMQIAPVFSIVLMDVNKDGKQDFIAGGNLSATRSRTGKMTGNTGFVFLGDDKGNFEFTSPMKAGLRLTGDVRHLLEDGNRIIAGVNNSPVLIYKLNSQ